MRTILYRMATRVGIVHRFLLAQEFRLLVAALAIAPVLWLIGRGEDYAVFTDRHVLEIIEPELGQAAFAWIPDAVKPVLAERGFRVCESQPPATRIGYFLNNRMARRFPEFNRLLVRFRCFDKDFGGRYHVEIRNKGGGLYHYDGETIRLSSSDESHPVVNGRVYLLSVPWAPRERAMVEAVCQAPIVLFGYVLARKRVWPWVLKGYRDDKFFNIVAASVLSTGITLSAVAIGMEAYLRWRIPFTEEFPIRFDPELGFVLQSNARVRWTNYFDLRVEQTSNSLGFLDREPAVPKPDGMFRVLVIGDSFVEAAQVGLMEKMHVLLEARLRDALGTDRVDTVAFSRSGTGQSNQLAFYDRYGADVDADLVVLLFIANDFGDNSTLLKSAFYGWDPYRPPQLFHEPDERGATFTRVSIDADWFSHMLAPFGSDPALYQRVIMERYPETRVMFGDWLPSTPSVCMFYADDPPPVFQRALASTEHALRLFKERTKNRGEALLLVIAHGVTATGQGCADDSRYTFNTLNQLKRITKIAERVGIPVLDLYQAFAARGDMRATVIAGDGHWSALGHRWAAEALADYLLEHGELLRPTLGDGETRRAATHGGPP